MSDYKNAMEILESLEEAGGELKPEQVKSVLGGFRSRVEELNSEAKTHRQESQSFKEQVEKVSSVLKSIGIDLEKEIDPQVSNLKKLTEVGQKADEKLTEMQKVQQQFAEIQTQLNNFKLENAELKKGIAQKEEEAIRSGATSEILKGLDGAGGIKSQHIRNLLIKDMQDKGAISDGVFTIEGQNPREYAEKIVKDNPEFQESTIVSRPAAIETQGHPALRNPAGSAKSKAVEAVKSGMAES